jgi:hypothetical protein
MAEATNMTIRISSWRIFKCSFIFQHGMRGLCFFDIKSIEMVNHREI